MGSRANDPKIPFIERFQKIFLAWNYVDVFAKFGSTGGYLDDLKQVPTTFDSIEDYKGAYEPLLIEECAAQIVSGSSEDEIKPNPSVVAKGERDREFLHIRFTLREEDVRDFVRDDLVLVSAENPVDEEPILHCLGFVVSLEGTQSVLVRFFLNEATQNTAQDKKRVKSFQENISQPQSCWWILKLNNMVTILREWCALQAVNSTMSFAQLLLNKNSGKQRGKAENQMEIPVKMDQVLEGMYNNSQLGALRAGLSGSQLVLIQGPPGTGKTKTILGLLSIILYCGQKGTLSTGKGALDERKHLTEKELLQNWFQQCPWILGKNPRDMVDPLENCEEGDDCYGLLRKEPLVRIAPDDKPKVSVLVCAPSNSALDEIIMRVLESGLLDKNGESWVPSVVRVGVRTHHSIKHIYLDNIVQKRMTTGGGGGGGLNDANSRRFELEQLKQSVLEEANIIFSTLSFSGSTVFNKLTRKFDAVVIDEAAQAVEPSVLVPLSLGSKQVYMVGDPVQLPATVISGRARQFGYDQSMFKRLNNGGYPINMLNVQYRMHPHISVFPAKQFYHGKLEDGPNVREVNTKKWHEHACFGPFAFFDLRGEETVPDSGVSKYNPDEIEFILMLFRKMFTSYDDIKKRASVAFISPYRAQVKALKQAMEEHMGEDISKLVDVNTIDGFQGREKDLVIFSAVRTQTKKSIGFVADERRLNVAITRARSALLLVGHVKALSQDENWNALIQNSRARRCMFSVKTPYSEYLSKLVQGQVEAVEPSAEDLKSLKPKLPDIFVPSLE
eukprot:TRINITY_DN19953_c0_g1_i1.p1 TRINITY_DN19953_c0_g1~~TRINITY_DN19953_c0_g1_i1.p1  ORF type:complete len:785 (-),score=164.49 TRINITY_DN19953_c0_g1_i1:160-2514(-)